MQLKITALTAAMLCFVCYANAQTIEKGKILIGGGLGFGASKQYSQNTYSSDSSKSHGGNITLSFGKAVTDNGVVGISLTAGLNKTKSLQPNSYYTKGSFFAANIFYRHFIELGKKFYFWTQPSVGFSFSDTKTVNTNSDYNKTISIGANLTPGLSYNLYKKLYLDIALNNLASISYNTSEFSRSQQKGFSFTSGLNGGPLNNLGLGFNVIF